MKATRKLIVFGAGGYVKVVIDILEQQGGYAIAGAMLTPGVAIGSKVFVGAGSCVIQDVVDEAKVSGVPARAMA